MLIGDVESVVRCLFIVRSGLALLLLVLCANLRNLQTLTLYHALWCAHEVASTGMGRAGKREIVDLKFRIILRNCCGSKFWSALSAMAALALAEL